MKSTFASTTAVVVVMVVMLLPTSARALRAYHPNESGNEFSLGFGTDIAFPLSNFSNVANPGFGINGNFQYRIDPSWDLLFNIGYIHWSGKTSVLGPDFDFSAVPFQGGAKYFFSVRSDNAPRFYIGWLIGFHNMSLSVPVYNNEGFRFKQTTSETEFSMAPLGGFEYGLSNNVDIDVSARYQYVVDDFSYFGLRVGFNFRLR